MKYIMSNIKHVQVVQMSIIDTYLFSLVGLLILQILPIYFAKIAGR